MLPDLKNGIMAPGRWSIQATSRAMVSHSAFLSRGIDDNSNCEAGLINFPNGKSLRSQADQGLYETTLRKEFA